MFIDAMGLFLQLITEHESRVLSNFSPCHIGKHDLMYATYGIPVAASEHH